MALLALLRKPQICSFRPADYALLGDSPCLLKYSMSLANRSPLSRLIRSPPRLMQKFRMASQSSTTMRSTYTHRPPTSSKGDWQFNSGKKQAATYMNRCWNMVVKMKCSFFNCFHLLISDLPHWNYYTSITNTGEVVHTHETDVTEGSKRTFTILIFFLLQEIKSTLYLWKH